MSFYPDSYWSSRRLQQEKDDEKVASKAAEDGRKPVKNFLMIKREGNRVKDCLQTILKIVWANGVSFSCFSSLTHEMGCGICKFDQVNPEPSAYIEPSSFQRCYAINPEDSFNRPVGYEREHPQNRSRNNSFQSDSRVEMTRLIQDLLRSYFQSIHVSPVARAQCEVLDHLLEHLSNSDLTDEQYVLFLNDMKEEFLQLLSIAVPQNNNDHALIPESFDLLQMEQEPAIIIKPEIRTAQTTPVSSTSSKSTQNRFPERHRSFFIAQELLTVLC